jgi:exopolyphosphatase/guanosine-5'-triphosphate,3'-diphosphate pyrophosphatase
LRFRAHCYVAGDRLAAAETTKREVFVIENIGVHGTDASDPAAGVFVDESLKQAVLRLAAESADEEGHGVHVARLSLALLDQLEALHDLGADSRVWLWAAARLHDIGWRDGQKGHHKSSRDRILAASELPLDQRERIVVAAIARYHRKALPKAKHKCFGPLSESDRRLVRVLGGLVRLADGLDRTHRGLVRRIHCHAAGRTVHIRCFASESIEVELEAARRKSDLFCQALGVDLRIDATQLGRRGARGIEAGA